MGWLHWSIVIGIHVALFALVLRELRRIEGALRLRHVGCVFAPFLLLMAWILASSFC